MPRDAMRCPGNEVRLERLPLRDDLRRMSPYQPPQLDVSTRLNANESPFMPAPDLLADLTGELARIGGHLHRYPDRDATELRADLARYLSDATNVPLDTANIWAANGSLEVLQHVMQAFGGPGRTALGFEPSYSMYSTIAASTHTRWLSVPRRRDFTVDVPAATALLRQHQPALVVVASPNNPTGDTLELAELMELLDAAPAMVLVDEAYAEFSTTPSAVTLIAEYGHQLVVSRTLSKAFGFAGIRLGYLAAAPAVIDALRLVRLPYHVSSLAQVAARVALRHAIAILGSVAHVRTERDRIAAELAGLGYRTVPSDANFILLGYFGGADGAARSWQAFLDRGVLVRDVNIPRFLRVTIGTPEENDSFLRAAKEIADLLDPGRIEGGRTNG